MKLKKKFLFLLSVTLIISMLFAYPVAAGDHDVKHEKGGLQPGETVTFNHKVPINLVFIGYGKNTIDTQALLAELPETYDPIVRVAEYYYGLPGRDLGLSYKFNYNISFADSKFTNKFFQYLKTIGVEDDPNFYQELYNAQDNNVLEVTGPVLYIDAPSVENWLAQNLKKSKGYTVVFINWYSRPDFRFHLYTKTDMTDPDTGHNFGEEDHLKLIAWGGSHSRVWFYDLSAGPEWNTDNWNVDDPDLDPFEDGPEQYRMPPIWEYTTGGYRDPSALSSDLGLVTRFVGINLLFTTSPLYDPLVTAPDAEGDKIIHINMLEDDPGSLGTDWIDTGLIQSEFENFESYYDWQVNLVDYNPIDSEAQRAFRIFADVLLEDDCWNDYGTTFAELFCFFDLNRATYLPAYEEEDYVIGVYAFNTTGANLGSQFGLLGYADDNWFDGTQSYVFQFDTSEYRDFGYGFTSTTIHEVGHHIGMSHPHDGYDSELGFDYEPGDDFWFAWSGDESNSVMSYMGLSNEFGQFDQDNLYRWETAGYLNWSNLLLGEILAHPDAGDVKSLVASAEKSAKLSIANFEAWNYEAAASHARLAYEALKQAADLLGISTLGAESDVFRVPNPSVQHEGDPIRHPDF